VCSTWSPVWGGDQCPEWTTSEKWEGIFREVRGTDPWCPRSANPVRINKELQLQGRLKKHVRYNLCKFFTHVCWEATSRELFLSVLSGQMRTVSFLARVRSETRRRQDFLHELSIKIWKFKIRCVAFSGSSALFYRWFSSELMHCVFSHTSGNFHLHPSASCLSSTSRNFIIRTGPWSDMVKRSDLGYWNWNLQKIQL